MNRQDLRRGFRFGDCGIFVLALLMAFSIHVVYPQDAAETTVVGQNDPTVDVQAVQDAVDHFDIVNLAGTFHFGDTSAPYAPENPRGGIRITRAGVTLRGEGKDATRIVGGGRPVTPEEWPYWPTPIFVDGADAVKIHGLTLDGFLGWAIMVRGCRDFESIGVRIINGVAATDDWYRFGWYFGGMQAPGITGDVLIQDCEYQSADVTAHWEDAICAFYGTNDAHFTIVNNTLEVGSRVGPEWMNDAIQVGGDPLGNTARIEGNTLAAGAGIFVHGIRGAEIRDNQITATKFGLLLATPTPEETEQPYIIERNTIHMEDGSAAIGCGTRPQNAPWAHLMVATENTLSGNADVGFLLEGSSWGNEFVIDEDEMEELTVTTAHVSLGPNTGDNRFSVSGGGGLVILDQGTNNAFVCPAANVASATMTPALTAGQPSPLEVTVVLDVPLEATDRVILDLSLLGIPSEFLLYHAGEGRYTLSTTVTPLVAKGRYFLLVLAETAEGNRQGLAGFTLDVYPEGDLIIYEDELGTGWTIEIPKALAQSDLTSSTFVRSGSSSHAILLQPSVLPGTVQYVFGDPKGIDLFGYIHLHFYINGGEASGQDPQIAGKKLSDLGIKVQADTWTPVSIPFSEMPSSLFKEGRLTGIPISGMIKETFYIDDMKLVAMEPPEPTAVEELEGQALPSGYVLSQNVPNPFNPVTTIAYDLPRSSDVTLTIYTITGQRVTTLVSDHQEAGHYVMAWDGDGCASGIYFYRLEAGEFVETRRMVLLK